MYSIYVLYFEVISPRKCVIFYNVFQERSHAHIKDIIWNASIFSSMPIVLKLFRVCDSCINIWYKVKNIDMIQIDEISALRWIFQWEKNLLWHSQSFLMHSYLIFSFYALWLMNYLFLILCNLISVFCSNAAVFI